MHMNKHPVLNSEDDVRTKVIVPWLHEHGFEAENLSIEFSFSIRLGRSVLRVENGTIDGEKRISTRSKMSSSTHSARADVLVRNSDGSNLFIIEVKAPNVELDIEARDQAISYARLLADGNIAPFVILANGRDSAIFDTFTKEKIDGKKLCADGVLAGQEFILSTNDIALRAEALESMISLSSDNLVSFCKAQVAFRMKPLAGDDIESDKKYIPSLFIEREEAKSRLLELLDGEKRRVVLLIGPPQVGKTNFVCHLVQERLRDDNPCLFFPAIGLRQSLLYEILEDFEWSLGGAPESYIQIIRRLSHILRRVGKTMTIFIDGWNEANIQLARTIDAECSRISCEHIQIVVSLTHTAASRLLSGYAGNPAFLAEEAALPSSAAKLIELNPEAVADHYDWSIVSLKRYSQREMNCAYEAYAAAYNVTVPKTHERVIEPYVIGAAMKLFRDSTLPDTLDEPSLLQDILKRKIARTVGLEQYNVHLCLRELASEMYCNGAPVSIGTISKIWSIPLVEKLPTGFFEAALLASETDEVGHASVDFYYGRERDYSIAYISQAWAKRLEAGNDVTSEFEKATTNGAGADALGWFFRQPIHQRLLLKTFGKLPHYQCPSVRQILLNSLCSSVPNYPGDNRELLRFASGYALQDEENLVKIEAARLVSLVANDVDDLVEILSNDTTFEDFVEAIFSVGEEFPLQIESVGSIVMDALRTLHWDSVDPDSHSSEVTYVLSTLSNYGSDIVRAQANTCFGYISPHGFLEHIRDKVRDGILRAGSEDVTEYIEGLKMAEDGLLEAYYGSMCPGALESILDDPDTQRAEYAQMLDLLGPIISVFSGHFQMEPLLGLLDALGEGLEHEESNADHNSAMIIPDTYTLPLPFDDC